MYGGKDAVDNGVGCVVAGKLLHRDEGTADHETAQLKQRTKLLQGVSFSLRSILDRP